MRRSCLFLLACLATVPATVPARPVTWVSTGPPDAGWVLDVAIGQGAAYAATFNGVFRSADGGATWKLAGLQGTPVIQLAAHPDSDVAFARTVEWIDRDFPGKHGYGSGFLFVTRDQGDTWEFIDQDFQYFGFVSAVAIDSSQPSSVYVWSYLGVWHSTDSGASWTGPDTPGDGVLRIAVDLAVDPASHAIYAMTAGSLMRSIDAGASWTTISTLPPGDECGADDCPGSVAIGADGTVYAAREGVFCASPDSGTNWNCSDFPHYPVRIVEIPSPSPVPSPARVLVVSDGGLFASDDGGATWSRAQGAPGAGYLQALAADPAGTLVLAGTDEAVYRSGDRGDTWARGATGLQSVSCRALAIDPSDPARIWTGGAGFSMSQGPGLFRSEDLGLTWSRAGDADGPRRVDAIAIDPRNPSTLYAGGEAVFRSDDRGAHWTRSAPPGDDPVRALAVDPADSDRVLAGTGGGAFQGWKDDATGGRLFLSEDGGRGWNAVGPAQEIYSLLFDGRKPGTVYAGSYSDLVSSFYYPNLNGGSIWVSENSGQSWSQSTPEPLETWVNAFAVDPFEDGVVYAALSYAYVYRSADYGAHWEKWSDGSPATVHALVADPTRPGHLYAGTDKGVYRTTDGARTWAPVTPELPLPVWPVALSRDGRQLLAGTQGSGVYALDLHALEFSQPRSPPETRPRDRPPARELSRVSP